MQIVEVLFIKDTQSAQTGNEFYAAGTKAHFFVNQSDVLVAQARVVIASTPPPSEPPKPAPDYHSMTVKQLKTVAYERGIGGVSNMRKATLITVLED